MSRIAYVNGRYVPHRQAAVHIEDRGYQFADGVYEVIAVHHGGLVDLEPHLDRLDRSLTALRIVWPVSRTVFRAILKETLRRNRVARDGMVYVQVTRGVAPRNHAFPAHVRSSLVVTARSLPTFDAAQARRGIAVISVADERWKRCDIKSVALLPNVLAKQQALEAGADDAWMVDPEGTVTEASAANAWIVTGEDRLVTRLPSHAILNGITRRAVLYLAREHGLTCEERSFTLAEAKAAREAFVTSTTSLIRPVVRIDDTLVNAGRIGPLTDRIINDYAAYMDDQTRAS